MISTRYQPMLPTLASNIPQDEDWVYEIKYDGYRATLHITNQQMDLISRNLKSFTANFPEIKTDLTSFIDELEEWLPLVFDGELCVLASDDKANFETLQTRGRLKNERKIQKISETSPAHFLAFDLLEYRGNNLRSQPYYQRKQQLATVFEKLKLPLNVNKNTKYPLQYVPFYPDAVQLWKNVKLQDGEGIVAKKTTSQWKAGARTKHWLKIKNWKTATFFITAFEKGNSYFHVGVLRDGEPRHIGLFSHGMKSDERAGCIEVIKNNKIDETKTMIYAKPGICVELKFLELYKQELRHPRFERFRFDIHWEECTWEAVLKTNKSSTSAIKS